MKKSSLRKVLVAVLLSVGLLAGCDSSGSSDSGTFFTGNGSLSSSLSTGGGPATVSPGTGTPVDFTPGGGDNPLPPGVVYDGFLYVSSPFAGDISALGFDVTGFLSVIEVEVDGTIPAAVVPSPDGRYLYSLSAFGKSIRIYAIDEATGALNFLAPQLDLGQNATGMVFSPDQQFAYVASPNTQQPGETEANDILTFSVADDGRLTQVGTSQPAAARIRDIAISPDGAHVYISNDTNVQRFDVDPVTQIIAGTPVDTLGGPTGGGGIEITNDGNYLYLGSGGDQSIYQYTVQPDGTLTPNGTLSVPNGPGFLELHPTLPVLYDQGQDLVRTYNIGTGGVLQSAGPDVSTGLSGLISLYVEPSGRFLYGVSDLSNSLVIFSIAPAGPGQGTLTLLGPSSDAVNATLSDPRQATGVLNREANEIRL